MKLNKLLGLLCLPLLLLTLPALSQTPQAGQVQVPQLQFSHSIAISSPSVVSIDRSSNIYLLDKNRNLLKLDSLGQPLVTYSPPFKGRPTSLEAWNPMKLLLFYEDRQEILLLDRFMRPISQTSLADYDYSGTVVAATLSSDDSFWLFNESNFTLSKLDQRVRMASVETPLGQILNKQRLDIRFMREYQNLLYILDANEGIYIFDNLGNYKSSLPFAGLASIGFLGNELYFLKEGKLHFYDLYRQQTRSISLPPGKDYKNALASSRHIYLFTDKEVEIYNLLP